MNEDQLKALSDAVDVMDTERGQLAYFLEHKLKAKLSGRTERISVLSDECPHRVQIAINNEMDRLSGIARQLRSLLPKPAEQEEEEP